MKVHKLSDSLLKGPHIPGSACETTLGIRFDCCNLQSLVQSDLMQSKK